MLHCSAFKFTHTVKIHKFKVLFLHRYKDFSCFRLSLNIVVMPQDHKYWKSWCALAPYLIHLYFIYLLFLVTD